jgi:uncharacterized protein (TIGR03437 family)
MKHATVSAIGLAALAVLPVLVYGHSDRPPDARKTGAPGDGETCEVCHRLATPNTRGGNVHVAFPAGLTYTPGVVQELLVTVADTTGRARKYGFQMTARLASDPEQAQAGDFQPADPNTVVRCDLPGNTLRGPQGCPASESVQFIEHAVGTTTSAWRVNWVPPTANAGTVSIYVAGLAADGNRDTYGDDLYIARYDLAYSAGQPAGPPLVAQQNGVVNGASFRPGFAASAWISIFGTNLASSTRMWRGDEIVNGQLPMQLDDISVTVNNKPAAVYYISPTQINVQAPADDAVGQVVVTVNTARGASWTSAALNRFAPGFFKFDPAGRKYIAARHPDGAAVGPAGIFGGDPSRPAAPGQIISLYGTGFGATNPALPPAQVVTVPAVLAEPVTVRFGSAPAEVQWAGISGAGLYQFNVVVPDVPNGDVEVVAEIGGVRTGPGDFIFVQRP